jgi:Zn-finger nucleic acid-binding protein
MVRETEGASMSERNCIKCDEKLKLHTILDVEIDLCPGCGGMWLDDGEIKQLSQRASDALSEMEKLEKGGASGNAKNVIDTPCPACKGKLMIVSFGPTNIEHCSGCGGVFLDRGELEKAMKLVDSTEATTIVALARSVETSGVLGG